MEIPSEKWLPGDIVSRIGSEEQVIIEIDHDWGMLYVEVIKPDEPDGDGDVVFEVGERESNLIRRYIFVRRGTLGASQDFHDATIYLFQVFAKKIGLYGLIDWLTNRFSGLKKRR